MYLFNPSFLEKTIIPDNTENAEAFLYEYTNLKNNMKYVHAQIIIRRFIVKL